MTMCILHVNQCLSLKFRIQKGNFYNSYNISLSYNTCWLTSHCVVVHILQSLVCIASVEYCYSTQITTAFSGTTKYHYLRNEEDALRKTSCTKYPIALSQNRLLSFQDHSFLYHHWIVLNYIGSTCPKYHPYVYVKPSAAAVLLLSARVPIFALVSLSILRLKARLHRFKNDVVLQRRHGAATETMMTLML